MNQKLTKNMCLSFIHCAETRLTLSRKTTVTFLMYRDENRN